MKKKLFLLSAIPLVMGSLTGCGEDNRIKVGIMTIGFPAVAVAADGFLAELSAAGIAYNALTRIPSNDASAASIALDLASQCDYLLGVGTGNSQKLKGAIEEKGKAATSTLFFTAVTDPVDAGLVSSWDNPSGFVCGTSDMNPVAEQIDLILECIPTVDKVGIFYTNSESNSRVQKDKAVTRLRDELGITAVYDTCTNSADITTALSSFLQANPDMDALYIPTDNNIANNPGAVKTAIAGKGILVVCGEGLSLKDCGGCDGNRHFALSPHQQRENERSLEIVELEKAEHHTGNQIERFHIET